MSPGLRRPVASRSIIARWKSTLLRRSARVDILVMKFRLLVEFDPKAKRWSAVFPELPGCATAGDTEAEAITNAQEALALWFEPAVP
jgi:predicted RNase H-like HicB family nuclease